MLTIDYKSIEEEIKREFECNCQVKEKTDQDYRFTLELLFDSFTLEVIGSDARVLLKLHLSECEPEMGASLLTSLTNAESELLSFFEPFKLTLWKNNRKDYKFIPSLDILLKETNLIIELCTGACDISTSSMARQQILPLLKKTLSWLLSTEVEKIEELGGYEGARSFHLATKVERSEVNRRICLSIHGLECKVCNEKMTDKYGPLAEGFIHVHHIEPIAEAGVRWVNPQKDLIPVCPNCHSMIHRTNKTLKPEELRQIIMKTKKGTL